MSPQRRLLTSAINRLNSRLEGLNSGEVTRGKLSEMAAALESYRAVLSKLEEATSRELDTIERLNKSPEKLQEEEDEISKDYTNAMDAFVTLQGKYLNSRTHFENMTSRNSILSSSMSATSTTRLPKIEVPKFSGDNREFINFKAMFENTVNNNPDLNNVQKLYYLRQALSEGDAFLIVRDFELSEDSFPEAWNLLVSRYENRRAIIRMHFRDLCAIRSITNESEIRALLDNFSANVRALRICNVKACSANERDCPWQLFLSYFLASKLDNETVRDWENSVSDNQKFPPLNELVMFLQNRCFSYEGRNVADNVYQGKSKSSVTKAVDKPVKKQSFATVSHAKCNLCNDAHYTDRCEELLKLDVLDRLPFIKQHRLCTNCLGSDHKSSECKSSSCRKCNGRHHTVLHRDHQEAGLLETKSNETTNHIEKSSLSATCVKGKTTLLPSAVVRVRVRTSYVLARVLLDSCSQPNLISESFARKHKLRVRKVSGTRISGIGDAKVATSYVADVFLSSRFNEREFAIKADVISKIPYSIPEKSVRVDHGYAKEIKFAECEMSHTGVDMILGTEIYNRCVYAEKEFRNGTCMQNSSFGWVLSGPYEAAASSSYCFMTAFNVEDQLQKFWRVEEASPQDVDISERNACVRHFESTYSRAPDGQFIVRLPFKVDRAAVSDTFQLACNSLSKFENRNSAEVREEYEKFMREYAALNHMELVPDEELSNRAYYIPHRAVFRPLSTTTKLRVVFNASAKSKVGKSLNEALMVGPNIQPELIDTLMRFRNHPIAICADVSKMYRCILLHPDDVDMQRIVWREKSGSPLQHYRLKTITYGTAPASFIATKCLNVIGEEIAHSDPLASRAIKYDFYMDDLLTGSTSEREAMELQKNVHNALSAAHFPLRKYMSNSEAVLNGIEPELRETLKSLEFLDNEIISVLGLEWNPTEDSFRVKLNLRPANSFSSLTKRLILSEISKIFDPLGMISPITIRAKIMLQDVWREQLTWDDPVSEELSNKFREYYTELSNLNLLEVPRKLSTLDRVNTTQIVGFCDASEKAYCAAVYLRTIDARGKIDSRLIVAKTRVAPLKALTIPRLELQAALLLAELVDRTSRELKIEKRNVFAFSDSTIVLCWLSGDIDQWTSFVRNRVAKIVTICEPQNWRHVKSGENPADLATRGLSVKNLLNNSLWFNGPSFLV